MALALLERTNRRYHEVSVGYVERAARIGAFLGCWRPKPLAIDSAMNNRDALSIDARGRQRIGDASGDCDHAIDRAIEQIRREHAIGPVVHPPRHYQRAPEATRQRRHRMRARSMKMNYVVALALEDRAQLDA